jgi:hypothetical protein
MKIEERSMKTTGLLSRCDKKPDVHVLTPFAALG